MVLNGRSGEFFVIVAPGRDQKIAGKTLALYGYREGVDYAMLAPARFSVDWRE